MATTANNWQTPGATNPGRYNPTVPVGVISWLFGGTMYLAQAVEYSVQIGRTRSSSFEWLFPLTGFRASESGIDCRIFTIIAVSAVFVFVATRPAITVLDIRTARIFAEVVVAC